MPLTTLEWSVGLGSWIGLILVGLIISNTNKAEPFILSVLPIITITAFYILIHAGFLALQLLLWTLSVMFDAEILMSAFIVLLITLIVHTIQNARSLVGEQVD